MTKMLIDWVIRWRRTYGCVVDRRPVGRMIDRVIDWCKYSRTVGHISNVRILSRAEIQVAYMLQSTPGALCAAGVGAAYEWSFAGAIRIGYGRHRPITRWGSGV